ncbi:MAG: sugar nucleotide-binding protein [Candidatus Micrarchaeota archaeon]
MKIVIGAKGRLGKAILKKAPFTPLDKNELDITDKNQVKEKIRELKPETVINCAAFTDVNACEKNVDECWRVNVYGVKNLLEACMENNAKLIHFSSNYAIEPVNEYAWTKKASEKIVEDYGIVIRTSLYAEDYFMVKKLLAGEEITAFNDSYFNPISVYGLADEVIKLSDSKKKGVVNIGTIDKITPFDFAKAFCKEFSVNESLVKGVPKTDGEVKRARDLFIQPENELTLKEDLKKFKKEGDF